MNVTVAVKVLTGVIFVKDHAKPSRAEHHVAGAVVDRPGALVASAFAVARRAQRNLVSVPQRTSCKIQLFSDRRSRRSCRRLARDPGPPTSRKEAQPRIAVTYRES